MIARSDEPPRSSGGGDDIPWTAEPFLPRDPPPVSLTTLRQAVQGCRGCDLYLHATQAVFGEGRKSARIMLVGEQPGDQEDREGRPFVGPAGRMLDKALDMAGIDRGEVYLTNAVKHFKFTQRGKRRIHSKPSARQVKACRPWLEAELEIVKPDILVALGATAALTLFGPGFRVSTQRGQSHPCDLAPWCMGTVHPSSLLRAPDDQARRAAFADFVRDLKVAAREYARLSPGPRPAAKDSRPL